jgi:hypothetical protein
MATPHATALAFAPQARGLAFPPPEAGSQDRSPACPYSSVSSEAQAPFTGNPPLPRPAHPHPRQGHNGARRGLPSTWGGWGRLIIQVAIAFLGGAAILLVSRDGELRALGFLLGLLSQPFWLVATWQARQWGMFAVSLWYCLGWGLGAWRYWA